MRSLLNPSAKFIRLTRSLVFTHVSAVQLYPFGVCIPYSGIPSFSNDCTRGIAFFTSAPLARTADITNSSGVFIFARYTSDDQNSGESNIVRSTVLISPLLARNAL